MRIKIDDLIPVSGTLPYTISTRKDWAALHLIEHAEQMGRAATKDYACEDNSDNDDCTLFVAAVTPVELARLLRWTTVDRIGKDDTAEIPEWNVCIYYCGSVCELPIFNK